MFGLSKIQLGFAAALMLAIGFLAWRLDAKSKALTEARTTIAAQKTQIDALNLDAKLKETASLEREADHAKTDTQAQELTDARTHPGDDADTRRLRSLCSKLRQQDLARFNATAACGGFAG